MRNYSIEPDRPACRYMTNTEPRCNHDAPGFWYASGGLLNKTHA